MVSCRGRARHTNDLPRSKCEMAKVNCCRDQQLPWSLWFDLQASCSHQTWRGHGQSIGPGAAVVRLIVSCPWPARHTNDIPPSNCEMAKVNCCRPLRPAVALVALARPAGKLQPLNFAWACPKHRSRCCSCTFHRILSWPARHTNDLPPSKCEMAKVNCCRPLRPAVALVVSGSASRQAAATKLGMGMAIASPQVLPLSVFTYLVVGRRVTPMIYRQVSVKWPK